MLHLLNSFSVSDSIAFGFYVRFFVKSSGDTLKSIFIFHICIYLYFLRFDFTSETDFSLVANLTIYLKEKKMLYLTHFLSVLVALSER